MPPKKTTPAKRPAAAPAPAKSALGPILGVVVALGLAGLYPILSPVVRIFWPKLNGNLNADSCQVISTLKTCEQLWIDQGTGYLYAACAGTPEARQTWFPCTDAWDAQRRSNDDYLAVVDTRAAEGSWEDRTTHVKLNNFHGLFGEGSFTSHGFGVWHDPDVDGDTIRIFLVNHRPSIDYVTGKPIAKPEVNGFNSTVEIFETTLGSGDAHHVRTVAHPLIRTPNDVEPDSKDTFFVTNDHHVKTGWRKQLDLLMPLTDVVYCGADDECKVALSKAHYANGIASHADPKDPTLPRTYYLSQTASSKHLILQPQLDHTLSIIDNIDIPLASDNVYVSPTSHAAYFAWFPDAMQLTSKHFHHPRQHGSPALIGRVERNDPRKDRDAFFGQKWKVSRVFEDDSTEPDSPSGITGAAVDEVNGVVYMGGVFSENTWSCRVRDVRGERMKF